MALAQTTYPDATGEVAVGSFPHLDITSVEVAADTGTNQITFTIFVEGDPTNPDWGRYMIALRSASEGTTGRLTGPGMTGETTGRPITFPSGMTHWIGTWNSGGAIWTYDTRWIRSGTVVPIKDGDGKNITITVPFSALALGAGETFAFDVFSSGGGGSDSAVDALSLSTSNTSALLYETNPLRKNFAVFTVPGDFNNWDQAGLATPTNAMTAAGTSLIDQFQWRLDYHFIGSGQAILYKYAGGSWSDNWGTGAGIGIPSGDNIADTIIASGIHRFTFDQVTFAYTFTRPTFADLAAYLAAYNLEAEPLSRWQMTVPRPGATEFLRIRGTEL